MFSNRENEFEIPYAVGSNRLFRLPLNRYFPVLPQDMSGEFIESFLHKGDWVLDPFVTSPALAIELARSGFNVFVSSNNPIIRLMIESEAGSFTISERQSALAELASSRRGGESLEAHIRSLYETDCSSCGRIIQPEAFLWHRDDDTPYAKIYRCPFCGDRGERKCSPFDVDKISDMKDDRLHRTRAKQRMDVGQGSEVIDEVMNLYSRRSLYFLFTLVNRIEGMDDNNPNQKVLLSMLLECFDQGSKLNPLQVGSEPPRQLSVPEQYRENNLWMSFEKAAITQENAEKKIDVSYFPKLPSQNGSICIYPGRLSGLDTTQLPQIKAAVTLFPRPSHVFWMLSAVWSGWIWGKETILPMKGVFHRKRYDWHWYGKAVYHVLRSLIPLLTEPGQLFAILPGENNGHLFAAFAAGQMAGFSITGLAYNPDTKYLQSVWSSTGSDRNIDMTKPANSLYRQAITGFIKRRNQEATSQQVFLLCVITLCLHGWFKTGLITSSIDIDRLRELFLSIQKFTEEDQHFQIFTHQVAGHQEKLYWLEDIDYSRETIYLEKVERRMIALLADNLDINITGIKKEIHKEFRGLHTPSKNTINECLLSYGEQSGEDTDSWHIQNKNRIEVRANDVRLIKGDLIEMGIHLGYRSVSTLFSADDLLEKEPTFFGNDKDLQTEIVEWLDQTDIPVYRFFIVPDAIFSHLVLNYNRPASMKKCILVIPASHSRWICHKLDSSPKLAAIVEQDWIMVKFRHIRQIADIRELTISQWKNMLENDPVQWDDIVQMTMFIEPDRRSA